MALFAPLATTVQAQEPYNDVAPMPHYRQVARAFVRRFPATHLSQRPLDESISAVAWTNTLVAFDFDRSYFLVEDLEALEPYRLRLHEDLRDGSLDFAFEAFGRLKERIEDRYNFVTNQLAIGFDFSIEEDYAWRRREAPWPRDRMEQDDLWRRRIKNEYLGFSISRELDEELALDAAANDDPPDDSDDEAQETEPEEAEPEAEDEPKPEDEITMPEPLLTPEAFVQRRYAQYRTVIRDSDAEWVLRRFMSAVASAYDPHSAYMSPSTLEDFDIEMRLSLVGVGALLRSEDGAAEVVSLIPGGPAERDRREIRLRPGDKIIGVGQDDEPIKDVLHLPLYRTVRLIRGEPGTRVVLLIIPASDPTGASTKTVDLIRDEVKLEEQAAASRVETIHDPDGRARRLGVIRLPAFYASMQTRDVDAPGFRSATHDVARALAGFNADAVEGVVLDLRNNGGGSLREAIEMTGLFIRTGPVVQVREARAIHVLSDRDPAVAFRKPVLVLVNRLSASASEIVAGALQDYGRAVIVGDSGTHGKGTVQTIVPLGDDDRLGSVKVTTATYYRISGSSTQSRGVTPDIVIPSPLDYMDLGENRLPNAMPWTRVSPAGYDPLAYLSDTVLRLRTRSEQRRNESAAFARHHRLVEHVREINTAKKVPLERNARKLLALAEREARRIEEDLLEGETDDTNGEDPVLDEALNILADLLRTPPEFEGLSTEHNDTLTEMMRRIFRR